MILILILAAIGAVLGRVRGWGALSDGGRMLWAFGWTLAMMPLIILGIKATLTPWLLLGLLLGTVFAWWLPTVLPRFSAIDMGRNEGSWGRDFGVTSALGLVHTLPAFLLVGVLAGPGDIIWLGFGGALAGICYEIGWRLNFLPLTWRGAPAGEALFGALTGALVGSAYLIG